MASKKRPVTVMRSEFLRQIPALLNGAVIESAQYGNNEVVSVFTPTKLAEKFRLEVTYACAATRNGALPIISATLYSPAVDIDLESGTARQILKMCYNAMHIR